MVLMDQAFYWWDISVDQIAWYMHAALLQKYSKALGKIKIDKEQLKKEIILGCLQTIFLVSWTCVYS